MAITYVPSCHLWTRQPLSELHVCSHAAVIVLGARGSPLEVEDGAQIVAQGQQLGLRPMAGSLARRLQTDNYAHRCTRCHAETARLLQVHSFSASQGGGQDSG